MKLKTKGTELMSHLAPLRAFDKTNESNDCDKTMLAIRQEDDARKYLIAKTEQPQYSVYLKLNLSGDPESDDPAKKGIDRTAVVCGESEHYVVKNSALMKLLQNVSTNDVDFVITEDGFTASAPGEAAYRIEAERRKERLEYYDESLINEADQTYHFRHGEIGGKELLNALRTPVAVSALGAKTGSLYSKAVHLLLKDGELGIEAFSSTTLVKYTNNKNGALPSGDDVLHLSISPKAVKALMLICWKTDSSAQWLYNSEDKCLMMWNYPYFICIDTEEIGHHDMPIHVPSFSTLTVNKERLRKAVNASKRSGAKSVIFDFGEHGTFGVHTPGGEFCDEYTGEHLGETFATQMTLPVDALVACLSGYQDASVKLCCEPDAQQIVITSDDGLTCAIMRK